MGELVTESEPWDWIWRSRRKGADLESAYLPPGQKWPVGSYGVPDGVGDWGGGELGGKDLWDQLEVRAGWGERHQMFSCRTGDITGGYDLEDQRKGKGLQLAYLLHVWFSVFVGFLSCGSMILMLCFGTFSFCLFVMSNFNVIVLFLFYFIFLLC